MTFTSERAEEFYSLVYGGRAGRLRTQAIMDDLAPFLEQTPPELIIDIGGGHAPVSLEIVEKYGSHALIVEPSTQMVGRLEEHARIRKIPANCYKVIQAPFEEWQFDREAALGGASRKLILCHGVIGWVNEPDAFLNRLIDFALKVGAPLSLLAGQLGGHLSTAAWQGKSQEVETLLSTYSEGFPTTNSGVKLFNSDELHQRLATRMRVDLVKGVRVISDLCPEDSDEEWLGKWERVARQIPELLRTANMVHFLAYPNAI